MLLSFVCTTLASRLNRSRFVQEIFPVIPASGRALWFALIPFVVALPISAFLLASALAPRNTRIEVSPVALSIHGEYSLRLDRRDLDLASARPVDLTQPGPHALQVRTMGTGMPGYSAGWFTTGGNAKAFVVVTDRSRVAYLPTRCGYSLLLSVTDPAEFIAQVRRIMAPDASRSLDQNSLVPSSPTASATPPPPSSPTHLPPPPGS